MLMDLSDRHLIVGKDGRYSARAANLPSINRELAGEVVGQRPSRRASKGKTNETDASAASGRRRNSNSGKTGSHTAKFEGWIEGGFFDQPRTLGDVVKKFRQAGIVVARTSIPQLLLKAVRSNRLSRQEAEVAGKNVWVYERAKTKA
jgi:hypothetical protein